MHTLVMLALMIGCSEPGPAAWAVDTHTIEPTDEGVFAIQRWDVFDTDWEKTRAPRDHVCGAVVLLEPTARELDCPDCVAAWDTSPALRETDCVGLSDTALLRVSAIGIGSLPPDLVGEDPHPGDSVGAWVQIDGGGWLPQGWAYAEVLDHGGRPESPAWDGSEIYTLWPDSAWPL